MPFVNGVVVDVADFTDVTDVGGVVDVVGVDVVDVVDVGVVVVVDVLVDVASVLVDVAVFYFSACMQRISAYAHIMQILTHQTILIREICEAQKVNTRASLFLTAVGGVVVVLVVDCLRCCPLLAV